MAKSASPLPAALLSILVLLLIAYVVYVYVNRPHSNSPHLRISVDKARARRFNLIIDVRTPRERELLGYYPNSIPIPLNALRTEVPLDISNRNAHILVYSNGDERAATAAEILYNAGYKNVRYITETYYSLMPGASM